LKKELGYGAKGTYLPIRTNDEGKPAVKPDVYIEDKIYTEAEMVSIFRVSNPDRKTREEMDFFPPLTRQNADGYFIMFDRANTLGGEPLAVGRVGWKYLPEHKLYLTTGIKIIDMYRGLGLSRSLWEKRDSSIIKNSPAIGMASNFSENWLKLIQSEGWKVDPPVESLPESIQDEVRETIDGDKPRRLISKNIDMAMKKAWTILKTDTRPDIRNEAQYETASLDERRRWQKKQGMAYQTRLNALRTHHTVDLTDVENPVYKEMKEYQDIRNFHFRQEARIKRCLASGKTECNDYYSMELEGDNRTKTKLKTTPTGKLDPYVELSLEAYNNLTPIQKRRYHDGMANRGIDAQFHYKMKARVEDKSLRQPVFPSPKYGGKSTTLIETTKEEYDNMDKSDRLTFHARMESRTRRNNNQELGRFHSRMYDRLRANSSLPNYYSPEHEQEEQ
jgi:hypothetical protein